MDGDLKKPEHDEIMLWLDKNAKEIIEGLDFHKNKILKIWETTYQDRTFLNEKPKIPENFYEIRNLKKVWEHPVQDKTFIIGFIDLLVKFESLRLYPREKIAYRREYEWDATYWEDVIAFEVKTKIDSLGELFRQIQMYKVYVNAPIVIVSPDDKYEEQIKSQGLYFVKYTKN